MTNEVAADPYVPGSRYGPPYSATGSVVTYQEPSHWPNRSPVRSPSRLKLIPLEQEETAVCLVPARLSSVVIELLREAWAFPDTLGVGGLIYRDEAQGAVHEVLILA